MKIETFTYPNGFRVIYQKSYNSSNTTHIHAFCDVGSVYEPDDIRGASHFIEHMCFKGTKKIPKTKDLLYYYDQIGAYFNAYTEKRFTAYTLKCMDEYVENSLKIMSDMILNSKFKKEDFKKEEMVVIEENIQDSDDLFQVLFDNINGLMYNGSSFQYPVDHVLYHKNKYNYEKIMNYYHTFYQPSRMVLSIVSNIPFVKFKNFLKSTYFLKKTEQKQQNFAFINYNLTPQNDIQISLMEKKNVNTTHLMIGFRVLKKDKYILQFLKHILSSTFNSRLFMLLRNDEGLTYTSKVYIDFNEHNGEFILYAEANKEKIIKNGSKPGVFPIIINMIRSLIRNGVTQKEIEMAKGFIKGQMNMSLEHNEKIVSHNGSNFLIYPDEPVDELSTIYDKFYKNITKEHIHKIIKEYFLCNNMTICMIGNDLASTAIIKKIAHKIR